jgi:hypothetical protein
LAQKIGHQNKWGVDGIMAIYCKLCERKITFDDEYVSEKTGKKIPLDPETAEPHECPVWKLNNRKYHDCRKGCGSKIYFDEDQRTESGKWIPIDKETDEPHECEEEEDD